MPIRYEDRKVTELRQLAKSKKIKYYYKLKKKDLISELRRGKSTIYKPSVNKKNIRILKYESCVKKVQSKQTKECIESNYKLKVNCYNPYSVCQKSIYKN